jgi:DNA-binding beta-propeller fold protein YncE
VECASNADCSGATPVCDSGSCHALPWGNSALFGSFGQGNSNIATPYGVVVSADMLTAWVTDFGNNRIAIWTRLNTSSTSWSPSTQFGSGPANGDSNFNTPAGVFVSADTRTVWVADSQNHRIAVWIRPSTSSTVWSYSAQFGSYGSGNDNFSYPYGIFVSADTLTAWVADWWNNRIVVWTRPTMSSTTWSYSTQFGSSGSGNDNFSGPRGIAVSADTLSAWVADSGNSRIAVWTRTDATSTTWSPSTQFGSEGSGNDKFQGPFGVFVSADTLTTWVADTGNNRISVWTRSDATSTTWSPSTRFGTGPGSGDSNFYSPNGVFVSADTRTAWVADGQNSRISIWTDS